MGGGTRANALEGKQVVVDPCQPRHTQHGRGGGEPKLAVNHPPSNRHTNLFTHQYLSFCKGAFASRGLLERERKHLSVVKNIPKNNPEN